MGNDGGSIPKRRELVKEAARDPTTTEIKEIQQEKLAHYWTTCPLSHQPLKAPIVSDSSGNLYSKAAVLEYLLPAAESTPGSVKLDDAEVLGGRVNGLRDVVEVHFQVDEDLLDRGKDIKWVCPITNKVLGPGVKAVYIVPCGHAFSGNAIKEVAERTCFVCNEPYEANNIVPILPTSATDKQKAASRAQKLRDEGFTHSLKKVSSAAKKRKNKNAVSEIRDSEPLLDFSRASSLQPGSGVVTPSGGIKNAETASLTARVLAEEQERSKRQKLGTNENVKSLFSSGNGGPKKNGDFMNRGFSIPAGARR